MNTRSLFTTTLLGLSLTVLAACGGGGGSDNGAETVPDAPTLSLGQAQVKTFRFSWTDVAGETEYRLLENPDGASGFSEVASIAADSESHDLIVFLPERLNARYILQACNSAGCSDSAEVSVSGNLHFPVGYLKADRVGAGDYFGVSVALDGTGNTLAIGATREDSSATIINGNSNDDSSPVSGAVYVFVRDGSSWVQQAYLKPGNTGAGDWFGYAVALSEDGNTLAVGAIFEDGPDDGSQDDSGAAYVFTRSNGDWEQTAYLRAEDASEGDRFGWSLGLSADGDTLLVGSPKHDDNPQTLVDSGAVYVFTRAGSGWTEQAQLQPATATNNARFGISVSLSGDGRFAAVGSPWFSGYTGKVSLFIRGNDDSWSLGTTLQASDQQVGDLFGQALALSHGGSLLAVSAVQRDGIALNQNVALKAGAVYIFRAMTANWSIWNEEKIITAAYPAENTWFGSDIDFDRSGTKLVVGATAESSGSTGLNGDPINVNASRSGAAYLFRFDEGNWSQQAYIKAPNTGTEDFFGSSLSLSADGKTLAVGAYGEDGTDSGSQNDSGAVYLY